MTSKFIGWTSRFNLGQSDVELAGKLRHVPVPLVDLARLSTDAAIQTLDSTLRKIHIPSSQEIQVLKRIVGVGYAHAATHYASEAAFIAGIYARTPPCEIDPLTVMITSEAGIGKSEIGAALMRLFGSPPTVLVTADKIEFPIIGGVFITIQTKTKTVDLLNCISEALGYKPEYRSGNVEAANKLRAQMYKACCCFIVVDEFQFLTQSKTANALVAKTLHFLRALGVPVFLLPTTVSATV